MARIKTPGLKLEISSSDCRVCTGITCFPNRLYTETLKTSFEAVENLTIPLAGFGCIFTEFREYTSEPAVGALYKYRLSI